MRHLKLFVVAVALLALVGVATAQDAAKVPPALPDYTKAPYTVVGECLCQSVLRPELNEDYLVIVVYADTGKPWTDKTNVIGVWVGAKGKPFYAEWVSRSENKKVRGYELEDGLWMFEREGTDDKTVAVLKQGKSN